MSAVLILHLSIKKQIIGFTYNGETLYKEDNISLFNRRFERAILLNQDELMTNEPAALISYCKFFGIPFAKKLIKYEPPKKEIKKEPVKAPVKEETKKIINSWSNPVDSMEDSSKVEETPEEKSLFGIVCPLNNDACL